MKVLVQQGAKAAQYASVWPNVLYSFQAVEDLCAMVALCSAASCKRDILNLCLKLKFMSNGEINALH